MEPICFIKRFCLFIELLGRGGEINKRVIAVKKASRPVSHSLNYCFAWTRMQADTPLQLCTANFDYIKSDLGG